MYFCRELYGHHQIQKDEKDPLLPVPASDRSLLLCGFWGLRKESSDKIAHKGAGRRHLLQDHAAQRFQPGHRPLPDGDSDARNLRQPRCQPDASTRERAGQGGHRFHPLRLRRARQERRTYAGYDHRKGDCRRHRRLELCFVTPIRGKHRSIRPFARRVGRLDDSGQAGN